MQEEKIEAKLEALKEYIEYPSCYDDKHLRMIVYESDEAAQYSYECINTLAIVGRGLIRAITADLYYRKLDMCASSINSMLEVLLDDDTNYYFIFRDSGIYSCVFGEHGQKFVYEADLSDENKALARKHVEALTAAIYYDAGFDFTVEWMRTWLIMEFLNARFA